MDFKLKIFQYFKELYKFLYDICYQYVKLKDIQQIRNKNASNDSLVKIDEEIKNENLIG